ncbi:MAG TPA: LysR family transcriptional regulator [Candidatus Scatomorpha gallistercoris]|nr:LysR family transcriptional regulator [Candidatus Scatomorpha gallistercoris]
MAVANTLNFSRAAERLRLTQPAVSHQISSLEDELGVKLFHRTSKSVRLTQEGYLYTQYAGEILRLFNASKGRLKAAREENQRVLGIGCRNTLELRLLTGVLSELRREDARGFVPSLRVVPHDALENLLYDAEIQIMPTFKEGAPKRAVYREMSRCGVVCAVSQDSELVGRRQVGVEDISRSGRIAISRPEVAPRAVLAVQNQLIADMNPNDIIFCESVEILSYVVASGFASAVLVDTPGIRVSGVEYIPVEGTETVSYGAAYMAEEMTELLRRFLEIFASMSK